MRLLLDANIVIWSLTKPERLRPAVRDEIRSGGNEVFVSTASLLEITSKASSGRLIFDDEMLADIEDLSTWLPVSAAHALQVRELPRIHADPFDRVIVAQAMVEGLTLVTGDRLLAEYGVSVLLT